MAMKGSTTLAPAFAGSFWIPYSQVSLPNAVAAGFGESVALLAEQPGIGTIYAATRTPGVRRLYLSRIRCFVYCKATSNRLPVLAFWHASRAQRPVL